MIKLFLVRSGAIEEAACDVSASLSQACRGEDLNAFGVFKDSTCLDELYYRTPCLCILSVGTGRTRRDRYVDRFEEDRRAQIVEKLAGLAD